MRVLCAIQARTGSIRLPRKVMAPLQGKTMLWHLVTRVMRAETFTDVVVICPMNDFVEISASVPCKTLADIRVGEADLLKRYFMAGVAFGADVVVRVPSDNPCVDPANLDLLVRHFVNKGLLEGRMLTNIGDYYGSLWPQGLGGELYLQELLRVIHEQISEDVVGPEYREHPHRIFHETGNVFEPPCPFEWTPPLRYDVNTQSDLEYIREVYNAFGRNDFTTEELLRWSNEQR